MEGLLNYAYYQTLALNQFDSVGHLLHFILMEAETGPCAGYNAGPTYPGGGTDPRTAPPLRLDPGRQPARHQQRPRRGLPGPALRRLRRCAPDGEHRPLPSATRRSRPSASGEQIQTRRRRRRQAPGPAPAPEGAAPAGGAPRTPAAPATRTRPDRGPRRIRPAGGRGPARDPRPAAGRPAAARDHPGPRAWGRTCARAAASYSDTSSDHERRTQQSSLAGGLADDGRRDHDAGRDRRRLPRLQREQRPAVRPDLPGLGRICNASRLGPNNEVRIGGNRVGVVESIETVDIGSAADPTTRPTSPTQPAARRPRRLLDGGREAEPEAGRDRRAAARGLDGPRPLPVLVRPQVPRDRRAARASRSPEGGTLSIAQGDRAGRVRRRRQHLRHRRRASPAARTSRASATRSPPAAPP